MNVSSHHLRSRRAAALLLVAVLALLPQLTIAAAEASPDLDYTVIDLIRFGGWVGYVIILLSVAAVALIVEYALSIRLSVLAPPGDHEQLASAIERGAWSEIRKKLDESKCSFLWTVVGRGVKEYDRGYDAVIKAMEDAADERTGALLRRIEHLNMIANIAPMLGLLGTVLGMVTSFNQISIAVGGVDPRQLARGIFQALMTTVMGLIVAIPSLYAFAVFRNRIDATVTTVSQRAEDLVSPIKNSRSSAA